MFENNFPSVHNDDLIAVKHESGVTTYVIDNKAVEARASADCRARIEASKKYQEKNIE